MTTAIAPQIPSNASPVTDASGQVARASPPNGPQAIPSASSPGGANNASHFASLYCGDLNPDVSEATLYDVFNAVGPVASIRVCRDTNSKKSLGYAYINFHAMGDAERALDTLNYSHIKNRACRLMWSHRDPGLRRSGAGNVYVKNLNKSIDNKALYDTFSIFGNILSCKVACDPDGKSRGFGFVHYEGDESALMAIKKLDGMQIGDKTVVVTHFKKNQERDSGTGTNFTNLYVKHMPEHWDIDLIKNEFGKYGEVTSSMIQIDTKGRRFAFVNFDTSESAKAAIAELHDVDHRLDKEKKERMDYRMETRKEYLRVKGEHDAAEDVDEEELGKDSGVILYVQRAQSKTERNNELQQAFKEKIPTVDRGLHPGVNLYVKNLSDDINDGKLMEMFAPFGAVVSCKVMCDKMTNISRGFGFVSMTTEEEANKAIAEMHLKLMNGKPLYVGMHEKREARMERLSQRYANPTPVLNGMPGMGSQGAMHSQSGFGAQRYGGAHTQVPGAYGNGTQYTNQPGPMYFTGQGRAAQTGGGGFMGGHGQMPGGRSMGGPIGGPGMGRGGMGSGYNSGPQNLNRGGRGGPQGSGYGGVQGFQQQGVAMNHGRVPNSQPGFGGSSFPPQQTRGPHMNASNNMLATQRMDGVPNSGQSQASATATAIANAAPQQQKQILGERLFAQISRIQPDLAGKITGMMLEMDNAELLILLDNEPQLRAKVDEALLVLTHMR